MKIEKLVTFRERTHPFFFPSAYISYPYISELSKKIFGHKLTAYVAIHMDNMRVVNLMTSDDSERMKSLLLQKIIASPLFIRTCEKRFRQNAKKLLEFCRKLPKDPSRTRLIKLLRKYTDLYMKTCLWSACHIYWSADALTEYLKKEIRTDFDTLSMPVKQTYVFEQELELLRIIDSFDNDVKDLFIYENYIDLLSEMLRIKYPSVYRKIAAHSKKFGFIPFDYIGPDY